MHLLHIISISNHVSSVEGKGTSSSPCSFSPSQARSSPFLMLCSFKKQHQQHVRGEFLFAGMQQMITSKFANVSDKVITSDLRIVFRSVDVHVFFLLQQTTFFISSE